MRGVWARVRAEVRSSLAATAALVLLIGVAAGLVIGVAARVRRTQTAYPRFLEATHIVLDPDGDPGNGSSSSTWWRRCPAGWPRKPTPGRPENGVT